MRVPESKPQKNTANRRKLSMRYEVIRRDGLKCNHCGEKNPEKLTIDHIVKRADGGADKPENMQILCWKCHSKKDGWGNRYKLQVSNQNL